MGCNLNSYASTPGGEERVITRQHIQPQTSFTNNNNRMQQQQPSEMRSKFTEESKSRKAAAWYDLEQVGRPDPNGGLRITFAPGFPGNWAEGIKYCCEYLDLEFKRIRHPQFGMKDQSFLYKLTAQTSVPALFYNDQRPRSAWIQQIVIAQRIYDEKTKYRGTKRLLPENPKERAQMIGILNEIAGDGGLMYLNRLMSIDDEAFLKKYPGDKKNSRKNCQAYLERLADILDKQKKQKKSRFFVGSKVTALDLYWAAFSVLFELPSKEIMVISDFAKQLIAPKPGMLYIPDILIEHRNLIFKEYVKTPVELGDLNS